MKEKLSFKSMDEFFTPIVHRIGALKLEADQALIAATFFEVWQTKLLRPGPGNGKAFAELDEVAQNGLDEELVNQISNMMTKAANSYQCFQSPQYVDTQDRMWLAADYAEWLFHDKKTKTRFNCYFVCRGNTRTCRKTQLQAKCLTLIQSKRQHRFFEDPMAYGQRWHC